MPKKGYKPTIEHIEKIRKANTGKKRTEETKRKLGLVHVGNKYWLGRHHSEETKIKIGKIHRGKVISEETKQRIRQANLGKRLSQETKDNISKAEKGRKCKPFTEEHKRKISIAKKSRMENDKDYRERIMNNLNKMHTNAKGKKFKKEHKENISKALKGRTLSKEHIMGFTGERNGQWKGGIKNLPYPYGWNNTIKQAIRQRDGYKCSICGNEGLDVHHIDYNKFNLEISNLITLCRKCHAKTNSRREEWKAYFREKLNGGFNNENI